MHDLLSSSTHGTGGDYDGVEVIHSQGGWVEIISSQATEDSLSELGLGQCQRMLRMGELVETELKENLESLQINVSPEDLDGTVGEGRSVVGAGGGGRRGSAGDMRESEEDNRAGALSRARWENGKVRALRSGEGREREMVRGGRERMVRGATGRRRGDMKETTLGYTYDHYVSGTWIHNVGAL